MGKKSETGASESCRMLRGSGLQMTQLTPELPSEKTLNQVKGWRRIDWQLVRQATTEAKECTTRYMTEQLEDADAARDDLD